MKDVGNFYVETNGRFRCECGSEHSRGALNGVDVYRCLRCGFTGKVPQLGKFNWHPDSVIDAEVQRDHIEGKQRMM